MLGDVNLFLTCEDSSESYDSSTSGVIGEIELMIALREARGKGFGKAILDAFLCYVLLNEEKIVMAFLGGRADGGDLGVRKKMGYLRVKIGERNERSERLFKGLGFERVGERNYFGEVELRLGRERMRRWMCGVNEEQMNDWEWKVVGYEEKEEDGEGQRGPIEDARH